MTPGEKKRKTDFTDVVMYIAIATKHARLIVLLITLALAGGLIFYIFSRPVYFSKSIIRYTPIGTGITSKEGLLEGERADRFSDDKWLKQFDAEHILVRVDKRLGDEVGAARAGKSGRKQVRAVWTTDRNVELNVWCYIPTWVTKYPEIMLEEFQKEQDERARELYAATAVKYTNQIAELTRRWEAQSAVENKVKEKFDPDRLKYDLAQLQLVPDQLARYRERMKRWSEVRQKLLNPVYTTAERLDFISTIDYNVDNTVLLEVDKDTKDRVPRSMQPSNGTVIIRPQSRTDTDNVYELERNIRELDRKIKDLSVTLKPGNPRLQGPLKQKQALEKLLDEELRRAEGKFLYHGRFLANKVADLEAQEPVWREKQKAYDKYLLDMNLIKQGDYRYDQKIIELQNRITEAELAINNQRVALSFKEFDLPIRDEIPISPNRLKIVLMSLALGLGLALGIPFLLEFMDQTVTNMEKMEEMTNMRGLGLVPDFEDDIAEAYPLIFDGAGVDNPDFIENFRVIRTNLLSSAATSKFPQVIMVTSTSPKEGKTVVSSNLAMSFAHTGEKTLIIDANLRRGIQHHLFGSRSSPGLSNILVEKYDVLDACRPTTMENLHILPCGDQLEGDIEQLGSPQFAAAIEKLRKVYQRIIVDATPVLGLAETSVMQGAMDGVILVIWTGQTPTRAVRTAIDILNDNHANFYGFVLNRLDLMATMNRFHYYYYTNHYYNRYQSLTRTQDEDRNQPR
ncbi:MAG: polysaccharide biosynthesis tyrosine autokinase [Limisphaerales bacterium]